MEWLTLQKNEKIIEEHKPGLVPFLFAPMIGRLLTAVFAGFVAYIIAITDPALAEKIFFGVFLVAFFWQFVMAYLAYSHALYVITNKRLIQKRGLIGFSVKSVTYDRLADIVVRHSMMENLFGVGSLLVQTLAGQISRGPSGEEISFLYLKNPEEVQRKIFDLKSKFG